MMVKMTVPEVLNTGKGKRRAIFHAAGQLSLLPGRQKKKKEIPQYIGVKKLRSSPSPFSLLNSLYGNGRKLQCPNLLLLLPPSLMPKVLFCVSAALLSLSLAARRGGKTLKVSHQFSPLLLLLCSE